MLNFRLTALNSVDANSNVLAAWELAAFFLGEATVRDLPLDKDEARIHFIETFVKDDEQGDYYEEPHLADAEMMESLEQALVNLAQSRIAEMNAAYPFTLDDNYRLVRKPEEDINLIGLSYLVLQFFRALSADTIEIDGSNDDEIRRSRQSFERHFRNIFEYIAGYAVSGARAGSPYMTSHCRSSKHLEKLLILVCQKIGAGQVQPHRLWNDSQLAANDGGVDCLVHIGGPGVPGDAEIALVGATVQQHSIDQKIIGPDKVNFFRRFFSTQPTAFRGILVRVQDEDALTKDKCIQKDCLLFTYDKIWRSMATRVGEGYQLSALIRLDAKVRKMLRLFSKSVFLHEYGEHRISLG